jgi:hypothetical protein
MDKMDAILDRIANAELTPDQRKKIDIELVRYAISSVYNDGIDELTIDDRDPGKSVSGRFVDRISQNRAKVYDYTLTKTDSGYKCIYKLNEDDSSDLEEEEDSSMQ